MKIRHLHARHGQIIRQVEPEIIQVGELDIVELSSDVQVFLAYAQLLLECIRHVVERRAEFIRPVQNFLALLLGLQLEVLKLGTLRLDIGLHPVSCVSAHVGQRLSCHAKRCGRLRGVGPFSPDHQFVTFLACTVQYGIDLVGTQHALRFVHVGDRDGRVLFDQARLEFGWKIDRGKFGFVLPLTEQDGEQPEHHYRGHEQQAERALVMRELYEDAAGYG